jgi:DNA polymerase I
MTPKKRLVILDTHAILHRAYHALPDFSSSKGEPTGALYGLISMLVRIVGDLKPDYIVAAFDLPGPTYRHVAYEKYKAQRPETDNDLISQIKRSRDVLDAFGVARYECVGFEADDVIGTVVEELKHRKDLDLIIASGDMDTLQLVNDTHVRVFTLKKGLTETVLYDEKGVEEKYGFGPTLVPDYKGLRGDPSDNIPGVLGVGDKTASTLISTFGSLDAIYKMLKKSPEKAAYVGVKEGMVKKLLDQEEMARFSKMLAVIRRDAPIDFTLPKEEWRAGVSSERVLGMLSEFDFRSLVPRVMTLLNGDSHTVVADSSLNEGESDAAQGGLEEINNTVPQEKLRAAELAVWVLDSGITQPSIEDVYRVGKSNDFEMALKNLLADIKEKDLSFVYEKIEIPLMPLLRKMEQRGVKIDQPFLKKLSGDYRTELEKIAARIYQVAGAEFNLNSPKQLGTILFDTLGLAAKNQKKTAGGARSTRESELEKLKDAHPIVADILAYRELQKLLSTYIDTIPTLLDSESRLHTHFIQSGTTTGRIASQNPNLQNIPIKTELGRAIRHAFVASPGMQLLSFDYSQIELRIAAFLSDDEGLGEIFKTGRDVHREVAARVFRVQTEDVSYDQRRRAKVINFGILYGMGVNALRDALSREGQSSTRAEAQEFYDQYFVAFPQLARYIEEVKQDASRLGYTRTHFGRRRYFEGIHSSIPYVRASAERMAVNAPIQGSQADIVKLAMIEIDQWMEKENIQDDAHLLLTVHDELVFEVTEKKMGECARAFKKIMEAVVPEKEMHGIPLMVEGKSGPNWGQMEPLKI